MLAAPPPPIRLTEIPKPKLASAPRQEHITRAVHFPFASAWLTTQARQELDALKALLPEARTITLTGNTDRVGTTEDDHHVLGGLLRQVHTSHAVSAMRPAMTSTTATLRIHSTAA